MTISFQVSEIMKVDDGRVIADKLDMELEHLETLKKLIVETATFLHRNHRESYLKIVNQFLKLYDNALKWHQTTKLNLKKQQEL